MDGLDFEVLSYNSKEISVKDFIDEDLLSQSPSDTVHWINVPGLSDIEGIRRLGKMFEIHPLILEDILNTNQMVKMDNYEDCLFIVLKKLHYHSSNLRIESEHIGIVLKGSLLISFEENGKNIFEDVKNKLRAGKDRIRSSGADYLCYELINAVVDNYFEIIDELGDLTDDIEEELIDKPEKSTLNKIYYVKRRLMFLRKSVYPLRELIGDLHSSGTPQISNDVKIYIHDVYDHLIQIVDSIETYQDILSNMLDIYLSSISNKTNDTMKILTIFSTIFIPLTFLAGIYGMNFKFIPELSLRYGYFFFWAVSGVIAVLMLLFFHKKKWF